MFLYFFELIVKAKIRSLTHVFGNFVVSLLKTKKHLNFETLRKSMAKCFSDIPDSRQQGNYGRPI
jgi:hypothetical protein